MSQKTNPIIKNNDTNKKQILPRKIVATLIKKPLILIKIFTMKSVKTFESFPPYSSFAILFQGEKSVSSKRLIEKKLKINQIIFFDTRL